MTSKNTDVFRISVINRQMIDGEYDTVNESANGTFREKNGKFFIAYKNSGITSMIKLDGETLSVKRVGDIRSDMLFVRGESTSFEYGTKYGSMDMSIFTEDISCSFDRDGGMLKLRYLLMTGGDDIINDMTIKSKLY